MAASVRTIVGSLLVAAADAPPTGPVDIVIRGNSISSIRPAGSAAPEGEVIDGRGRLAVPGWVNGHQHSHEALFKGRSDNLPLELWMNSVRPLRPLRLTARQVYLRTALVAVEALKSGTTTLCDDVGVDPVRRPDHLEAIIQAYEDSGIRALLGPTLFDRPFFRALPFVDETFPKDLVDELDSLARDQPPPEDTLAAFERFARQRHPNERRVAAIAAPSAPQRCTDMFLQAVRRLADELALPLIIHVHETRAQVVTGQLLYGRSMVEHLHGLGLLRPATSIIHGVWLTPRDLEILAETGASLQHNPYSNLKLGSGVAPLRAALDAGVNVSLGSDGCGSIETVSMRQTVATAALLQKLRGSHERWTGAVEAFRWGTEGGAVALGQSDRLGRLEVGRVADLVLYRLQTPAFTPLGDPVRQLVYAEPGTSLDLVVVDGEVVIRDGRCTRLDEAGLLAELASTFEALRPAIDAVGQDAARLHAPYTAILRQCDAHPIPDTVIPARLP